MKKTIYKYFFNEFLRYFIITLFALSVIVWTIQSVNYLDLVSEDGHAFKIYFFGRRTGAGETKDSILVEEAAAETEG